MDQPPSKERNAILYNLSDLPGVALVCACNSQYAYFVLEDRVKSRLDPARILFEEYSSEDVFHILHQRVQFGLTPGSYTEDVLRRIGRLADGDVVEVVAAEEHVKFKGFHPITSTR